MTDLDAKLDRTLNILGSGLSGIAPESALHSIESWEIELQTAGKQEFTSIARDLAALRTHLNGDLDGNAIGRLLVRLGEQTSTVSGQAEGGLQSKLHHLGNLLTRAGNVLAPNSKGGGTRTSEPAGMSGATLGGTGGTASRLGTGSGSAKGRSAAGLRMARRTPPSFPLEAGGAHASP